MLSYGTIRALESEAAAEAAQERKDPLVIWPQHVEQELRAVPFLGEFCPAGWRTARGDEFASIGFPQSQGWHGDQLCFWVDSSGFAADDEPALSYEDAVTRVRDLIGTVGASKVLGFAVRQAGQFQVYIGVFVQEKGAEASESWIVREHSGLREPAPCCGQCDGCSCDLEEDPEHDDCQGLEKAYVRVSDGEIFCPDCAPPEALEHQGIEGAEFNRWPLG